LCSFLLQRVGLAVSLARLSRDQAVVWEPHALVAPGYGWFIEGFGTPDLEEAKTLLEEPGAAQW
jgi:hypothetical protein